MLPAIACAAKVQLVRVGVSQVLRCGTTLLFVAGLELFATRKARPGKRVFVTLAEFGFLSARWSEERDAHTVTSALCVKRKCSSDLINNF